MRYCAVDARGGRRARSPTVLIDEVEHRLPQVLVEARIGEAVARARVDHHLERLAGPLQLVGELHRVLHVHVVVDRAVHQQHPAVQLGRPRTAAPSSR